MLLDEDEEEEAPSSTGANGNRQGGRGHVDANSDLIPGVYEGGLKTWECALDLVETLDALHTTTLSTNPSSSWSISLSGKNILELGCGTALPTLFLLSQILLSPTPSTALNLTFHLADYNAQVLHLVTLPNLLLTWYFSPASLAYRTTLGAIHLSHERHELSRRGQDHFHLDENELAITDELVSSFTASLAERGIRLRFYSGSWSTFPQPVGGMDMVLTSETIYSLESLPSLVELLGRCIGEGGRVLVAAKVIYFGVGGGVESFKQCLGERYPEASVEVVHSVTKGVGRTVLSVTF